MHLIFVSHSFIILDGGRKSFELPCIFIFRFNKEEFPRPFLLGWFEGFWWSFVSMTTVGKGPSTKYD